MSKTSFPAIQHLLRAGILAGVALFFTGCFNYTEEMWLEEDGSGRLSAEMALNMDALKNFGGTSNAAPSMAPTPPAGFSEAELRAKMEGKKGIHILKVENTQTATAVSARWELTFDSLADLAALESETAPGAVTATPIPGPNGLYNGVVTWKKEGGTLRFTREIGENTAGAPATDSMSMGLATMMFAGTNLTFTTHFPAKVEHTSGIILEDGKSVRWVIPLTQFISGGRQTLTAEVAKPGLPWLWIGVAAFVAVDTLVMALVLMWVVKRQQDRADKTAAAVAASNLTPAPIETPLRTPDDDFRPR